MKKKIRAAWRLFRVGLVFLFAGLDFFFRMKLTGKASSVHHRSVWLQRWCRNFLKSVNGRVTWDGRPPSRGLLASNHLGYVDILAYGAIQPLVFLSKADVRSWPVIGILTACAGTLYIRRESRSDVLPIAGQMKAVVDAGVPVVVFLEGTSSGGDTVLPFRSSLLAPAAEHGWQVTPAWVTYELADGSVAEEVAYWRDMTFFPHLIKLLGKEGFEARVHFGEPVTAKMDRKAMAKELHSRVCGLMDRHRDKAPAPPKV